MHVFSRPLSESVKKARIKMNLTQEQVGALADTNTRTISSIENGKSNTRMNILYPLIRALRIDPNEIFYPELCADSSVKHQLHVLINDCSEQEATVLLSTSEAILDAMRSKEGRSATEKEKSLSPL